MVMPRKVFFLHIPKCGGTSLDAAILDSYGGGPRPAECARFDPVANLAAAEQAGIDAARLAEHWLLDVMAQRRARYVSGHVPYSETAYRAFGGEWDFVTLLRHPVARWFSHYFYNRYKAGDHYAIRQELPEFLASPRALRIANASLLYLSGREMPDILSQPRDCVSLALANLEKFAVVGCLERLDEFARRFAARYGAPLAVPRLQTNPAPAHERAAQISDAIRRRVEEMCRADLQVYEHVLARSA
jgi:hypothetical protein